MKRRKHTSKKSFLARALERLSQFPASCIFCGHLTRNVAVFEPNEPWNFPQPVPLVAGKYRYLSYRVCDDCLKRYAGSVADRAEALLKQIPSEAFTYLGSETPEEKR